MPVGLVLLVSCFLILPCSLQSIKLCFFSVGSFAFPKYAKEKLLTSNFRRYGEVQRTQTMTCWHSVTPPNIQSHPKLWVGTEFNAERHTGPYMEIGQQCCSVKDFLIASLFFFLSLAGQEYMVILGISSE